MNKKQKLIKVSGYFGSDSFTIDMDSIISIQDLIDTVHKSTGFPKTYAMSGGAPPNRKSFEVPYDYRINGIESSRFDNSASILDIVPTDTQVIRFEIIYMPRVD